MASGSFEFGIASNKLQGKIEWSSSSNGSSANSSTVTATLYAKRVDGYTTTGQSWSGFVKIGSNAQTNISFSSSVSVGGSWVQMATATTTIAHNNDGTGSVNISGSVTGPTGTSLAGVTSSGNKTVTLDTIPRYASITSFTVSKRNETSFTFNWAANATIDYVWYSTNNGSNWTGYDVTDGTSGSFTVSGLSPNTTYSCKLRVRRKDSQLNTDSSTVSQTTYKAPTQALSSKTETTITMSWSCDTTANHIWYSKDNGSNWVDVGNVNATSGTYTISSLSANTSYNIKTRVRRSSTSTTYDTSASSQTTYAYPYCTSAPNFTIGNNVTLTFYNPLNRTIELQMWSHVSQTFINSTKLSTSGTSYTFPASNYNSNLYASIPNATSSKYNIDVWYSGNKAIKEGGTYSINTSACTPTFSNFTYKDGNSTVRGVTGNDQVMVKGLSTVEVTISSANKMVAKNSATASKYNMAMSTLNTNVNYSSSDITTNIGTINASGTQRLTVTAYDSRGLTKSVYKDITVYDYTKPVVNVTITRLNNFENTTTLKVNGTYTRLTINNTDKNTITSVQYRYRETGGTWGSWTTLTTTVTSGSYTCADVTLNLDNTKSFEFEVKATDTLTQTTTVSANVDIGQAIFFISTNNRACYINGQELIMYDVVDTW